MLVGGRSYDPGMLTPSALSDPFVLVVPYVEGEDGLPQAVLTRSEFDPTRVYPGAHVVLQDGEVRRPAMVVRTELVRVDRPDHFDVRVAYVLDGRG